jgi:hypothetical protein
MRAARYKRVLHSLVHAVFPVPPFEELRIVFLVACVVGGTPEDVKDAWIDAMAAEHKKLFVQPFGVSAAEVIDTVHTEVVEILCEARTDARNLL